MLARHGSDLEIILDGGYDVRIVISDHERRTASGHPAYRLAGRVKTTNEPSPSKNPTNPSLEFRGSNRAIRNAVTGNPIADQLPDVYLVSDAVSFRESPDAVWLLRQFPCN